LKTKRETLGYYRERSHNIVDIDHCPIAHPLINQIILSLRQDLRRFSQMEEIEINVSPEEGKGVLVLHAHSFPQESNDFLKEFLKTHPVVKGIAILRKDRMNPLGDPSLTFPVFLGRSGNGRTIRFRASPESFFQVNLDQNQRLVQTVLEFSGAQKDELVLDLYAGIGNFTLPLASEAGRVIGIEENRGAVKDADFNRETNRIEGCEFIVGRVEEILENWGSEKPHLIVLDPPRTGCKAMMDQIVRLKPSKIIYTSCEPTTFARDLRLLSERGYHLQRLALIDMFPQSYHMEVVGLLKPIS
jgi:23S rRNA (uracil1939-C5)-methyltransferase